MKPPQGKDFIVINVGPNSDLKFKFFMTFMQFKIHIIFIQGKRIIPTISVNCLVGCGTFERGHGWLMKPSLLASRCYGCRESLNTRLVVLSARGLVTDFKLRQFQMMDTHGIFTFPMSRLPKNGQTMVFLQCMLVICICLEIEKRLVIYVQWIIFTIQLSLHWKHITSSSLDG